jgi:hypothetical protein
MRGTVAKELRKVAERATVTLPDRRYKWIHGARVLFNCTRAMYLDLKKRAKRSKRNA